MRPVGEDIILILMIKKRQQKDFSYIIDEDLSNIAGSSIKNFVKAGFYFRFSGVDIWGVYASLYGFYMVFIFIIKVIEESIYWK